LCSRAGETSLQSLAWRSAVDSFPNRSSREFTGPSRCVVAMARLATNDGLGPMGRALAGRWPLLRAPLAVAGCPARIRGPHTPHPPRLAAKSAYLQAFALVRSAGRSPGSEPQTRKPARPFSPGIRPHGPARAGRCAIHPSIDITVSVHSRATCPLRFGRRGATLVRPVPSTWFRTTSTASSAPGSRACCIPLPILGFTAFRAPRPVVAEATPERTHAPRNVVRYPSKDFPRRQPHHVTVAVAPLPLRRLGAAAPCDRPFPVRHPSASTPTALDFEALLRRRVRDPTPPLPVARGPILPGLGSPSRSLPLAGAPRSLQGSAHALPFTRKNRLVHRNSAPPPEDRELASSRRGPAARRLPGCRARRAGIGTPGVERVRCRARPARVHRSGRHRPRVGSPALRESVAFGFRPGRYPSRVGIAARFAARAVHARARCASPRPGWEPRTAAPLRPLRG
jgi:hypothetical protein